MARAQFHKNQRVYVRPVGTWALVERVVPHWTKGLEEPLRVFYDVGLGREFGHDELQGESTEVPAGAEEEERWRVIRGLNKWQSAAETASHPHPGTHPVVVTGEAEWGGWRVSGAEYAVAPGRIEQQAKLIAAAPRLASIVRQFHEWAQQSGDGIPESLQSLSQESAAAVLYLDDGLQ
jgi:hypothetical protein